MYKVRKKHLYQLQKTSEQQFSTSGTHTTGGTRGTPRPYHDSSNAWQAAVFVSSSICKQHLQKCSFGILVKALLSTLSLMLVFVVLHVAPNLEVTSDDHHQLLLVAFSIVDHASNMAGSKHWEMLHQKNHISNGIFIWYPGGAGIVFLFFNDYYNFEFMVGHSCPNTEAVSDRNPIHIFLGVSPSEHNGTCFWAEMHRIVLSVWVRFLMELHIFTHMSSFHIFLT